MFNVEPVDNIEVLVLVDNATDILSSPGRGAESELTGLLRRGMRVLSGRCLCCASHGFACAITAWRGEEKRTLLFDTGPDPLAFMTNIGRLDFDIGGVDAIVLSHGHFDHVGAALVALDAVRNRSGRGQVPIYLHPGMFARRGQLLPSGNVIQLEDVPTPQQLREMGADTVITTEATSILDGFFHVSGEIERVTAFERGLPGHVRRTQDDQQWEDDPLIMDERFVVVNVNGKGLVVFSACSHAGIVNVLHHARRTYPHTPLHGLMGGLHLSGGNEAIIPQTIEALKEFDLSLIAAGHCTGWRAHAALAQAFDIQALAPTAVGKSYAF